MDTIGGLLFNHLGSLPKQGQEIAVGPVLATVRRMGRKRVEEVQIVKREEETEDTE